MGPNQTYKFCTAVETVKNKKKVVEEQVWYELFMLKNREKNPHKRKTMHFWSSRRGAVANESNWEP